MYSFIEDHGLKSDTSLKICLSARTSRTILKSRHPAIVKFNEKFCTGHKRRCCISERSDFALIDLSLGRFRRVHISIAFRALIVPGRWSVWWHTGGWQRCSPVECTVRTARGYDGPSLKKGETGFPNSWKFVKLPWPVVEHLIEDKWQRFSATQKPPFDGVIVRLGWSSKVGYK